MLILQIVAAAIFGVFGWAYLALIKPPPPKICGSLNGPPVTSPRIQLKDGRYLAYKERGIAKENAKYKIIIVHGFDSSKDENLPISQDLIEELQIYLLSYDRAGYGESDPHSKRSVKSEGLDIQELANKLQLGPKFYVVGLSMGAYPVWGCLNYIPHRLAGVALVGPAVNYWWTCYPSKLSKEALKMIIPQDKRTFQIAHYAPWLINWWMNQKWFHTSSYMEGNMAIFCDADLEIVKHLDKTPSPGQEKVRQQGEFESLYRDLIVGYGKWEFDPTEVSNPFQENEGKVHLWQGYDDRIIPRKLNQYLAEKLHWIQYHEVPYAGHFLIYNATLCETILRKLVNG
ncbi:PREDICTED: uncharacterized protein LOC109205782 [Nicotiana attenuata]|uniref:uncharacterized protein LOC109205782 n=1 Tax=Nicotiana attenuata TaxID=49451 RepID=UPI0009057BB2|nr:PREDICTED: uncharacterized protein LOC109205782 [Nicotiana attenuata]